MRKKLLAVCALACMLSVPAVAVAQTAAAPLSCQRITRADRQEVTALIAQFSGGGPALRAAVARAVEADPDLADAFVAAARRANNSQKEAIGAGLADGANYFAKIQVNSARGAEGKIRTAMLCADSVTGIAFVQAETPTLPQVVPGFGNAGVTTCRSLVISPSGPGSSSSGC